MYECLSLADFEFLSLRKKIPKQTIPNKFLDL